MSLLDKLRARDPDLISLRKSMRAILVVPALFAVLHAVLGLQTIATYGFFGCLVGIIFANFGGPSKPRAVAYAAMIILGDILIIIGSLLSDTIVGGAAAMFVIIFLVSFAAVFGGYTPVFMAPAALSFSLAIMDPLSASPIDARIIGWTIGGAVAMIAGLLLWPIDRRPRLRRSLAEICGGLSAALANTNDRKAAETAYNRAEKGLSDALKAISTPLRPAGPTSRDIGLLRMLTLLEQATDMTRRLLDGDGDRQLESPLRVACADAFRRTRAVLLGEAEPDTLAQDIPELDHARLATDHTIDLATMQAAEEETAETQADDPALAAVRRMFPVKVLSHIAIWVEASAATATGAGNLVRPTRSAPELRPYSDRPLALFNRMRGILSFALDPDGVIFRNSIRAAAALSLAVVLAKVLPVDHGFWVTLAALLVLHSSAASTTATSLQAIAGTLIGFVIAALVLLAFGNSPVAMWVLLPIAIFLAGYMPGVVGFMIGQTSFTILVIVLYTLIDPVGITTDIARVETVALGAATGAVMSLILWPHGARVALARALETSYRIATEALRTVPFEPIENRTDAIARMQASRRRRDEAFVTALTERGQRIDVQAWMALFRAPNMVHSLIIGYWAPPSAWLKEHCDDAVTATIAHREQVEAALRHVADSLDAKSQGMAPSSAAEERDRRSAILEASIARARPEGPDTVNDVRLLILLNEWLAYVDRYVTAAEPELAHAKDTSRPWAWLHWSQPKLRERSS